MSYKISGTSSDNSTIYVLQADALVGYKENNYGVYDVVFDSDTPSGITVVAESPAGQIVGFGELVAVGTGDSVNIVASSTTQLLKSGQTTSYNANDDGDLELGLTPDRTRSTIAGGEVVSDNSTGLMWVADPEGAGCNNGTPQNWVNSISFADGLTFAGYSDWRMPNIQEMLSIVKWQPDGSGWYIDSALFGYLGGGSRFPDRKDFWTSTTKISSTTYAWLVNANSNLVNSAYDKTVVLPLVRPVRDM